MAHPTLCITALSSHIMTFLTHHDYVILSRTSRAWLTVSQLSASSPREIYIHTIPRVGTQRRPVLPTAFGWLRPSSLVVSESLVETELVFSQLRSLGSLRRLEVTVPFPDLRPTVSRLLPLRELTAVSLHVVDHSLQFCADAGAVDSLAHLTILQALHVSGVDRSIDFFGGSHVADLGRLSSLLSLHICWSLTLPDLHRILHLPQLQRLRCKTIPAPDVDQELPQPPDSCRLVHSLTELRCEQASVAALRLLQHCNVHLSTLHMSGYTLSRRFALFEAINEIESLTDLTLCSSDLDSTDLLQLFRPEYFLGSLSPRPTRSQVFPILRRLALDDSRSIDRLPPSLFERCSSLAVLSVAGTGLRSVLGLPVSLTELNVSRTHIPIDFLFFALFGHLPSLTTGRLGRDTIELLRLTQQSLSSSHNIVRVVLVKLANLLTLGS